MKSFAIFPTVAVFILTFSVLKEQFDVKTKRNLMWTTFTTIAFGGLFIAGVKIFSQGAIFLMLCNVAFAIILIPVLTFTIDGLLPATGGVIRWLRLLASGLISVILVAALFGASLLFAFANNPMDPPVKFPDSLSMYATM